MLDQIKREIAEDPYYRNNFDNDGQKFVAWYLRRVLLRDDAATRDDITDGADDKQIDAVIVDDADQRVVVIQGKFITTGQVAGGPLKEVLGAWVRLQDLPAYRRIVTSVSRRRSRPYAWRSTRITVSSSSC